MPDPVTDGPWSVGMLSEPITPEQWQPTVSGSTTEWQVSKTFRGLPTVTESPLQCVDTRLDASLFGTASER